ncbi:MAG: DUF4349 domain-containing protein [Acetatifactor sp.]|nr:DUF4349 domain-containing protein [Acetatifactor sp.]MDE7268960.1 DUF4349 domain-containing protein [Acetatifactor sp.]
MKKNRNFGVRWMAAGLAAAVMLGFGGCGSGSPSGKNMYLAEPQAMATNDAYYSEESVNYGYDAMNMDMAAADSMTEGYSSASVQKADSSAYFDTRKLIKTVNLDVETQEFDGLLNSLEAQVEQLGGYIESMNTYNGSRYSYSSREATRTSNLTVRIPQKELSGFVDAVSAAGNVVSRSENVEDVTLSYVDIESRKKSLETELERLQSFLEKAESLEDIITLEDRMSTVRYQLESMASQLRTYDNKVDFATVYMSIREVKELTPVEEETAWERLTGGFMESLKDVKDGFVEFFIWIVVHIPYLAVWAAVILIIVVVIKLIIRRNRRKKAEKTKVEK